MHDYVVKISTPSFHGEEKIESHEEFAKQIHDFFSELNCFGEDVTIQFCFEKLEPIDEIELGGEG